VWFDALNIEHAETFSHGFAKRWSANVQRMSSSDGFRLSSSHAYPAQPAVLPDTRVTDSSFSSRFFMTTDASFSLAYYHHVSLNWILTLPEFILSHNDFSFSCILDYVAILFSSCFLDMKSLACHHSCFIISPSHSCHWIGAHIIVGWTFPDFG